MPDNFTLDLVRAVSDWQRDSTGKTKITRGEKLKKEMMLLPSRFRECDQLCFRQECHQKDRTFQVLIQNNLPERIASWTTSLDVAESLKGGVVYGDDDRSIILSIIPPNESVVANLERLYDDPGFQQALSIYGPQVDYFYNGAGKYSGSQKEVVLELDSLSSAHVYSYGGYSGSLESLLHSFYLEHSRQPSEQEKDQISKLVGKP